METAAAFGRNRPSFLLRLTTSVQTRKTKEGKADDRAFSSRVLKDHAPLGSPWRGRRGLRRSANPWNLFKKSVPVLAGSVAYDKGRMLWSRPSGYRSWLHHLLVL